MSLHEGRMLTRFYSNKSQSNRLKIFSDLCPKERNVDLLSGEKFDPKARN